MYPQSWVTQSNARSTSDDTMDAANDNRRRILGSTIFGDSPQRSVPARLPDMDPVAFQPAVRSRDDFVPSPTFPDSVMTDPVFTADFSFDNSPISENFTLTFKPRPIVRTTPFHRLDVPQNAHLRILRDDLNRGAEQFSRRLRQIGYT
jgi:hypothetical protein